ncbi:MAG: hypothetical protein Q4G57_06665 [Bacillota bacterium]|nr:hypothetical protein [Bacillota bacterium]
MNKSHEVALLSSLIPMYIISAAAVFSSGKMQFPGKTQISLSGKTCPERTNICLAPGFSRQYNSSHQLNRKCDEQNKSAPDFFSESRRLMRDGRNARAGYPL